MKTGLRTHESASLRLSFSQTVEPHLRGGLRELSHLVSNEPGKGHARQLMSNVIEEADEAGVTLMLTADTEQLADWYSRLGFMTLQESPKIMVRLPARVMAAYG